MDAPSYPEASVSPWSTRLIICGMLFTTVDVVLDYYFGISYFVEGQYVYGWCTAAFVFIPALINLYISQRMYKQDLEFVCASGIKVFERLALWNWQHSSYCQCPSSTKTKDIYLVYKKMSSNPDIQRRDQSKYSKLIQRKFCWPFIILVPLLSVIRSIDSYTYAKEARKCEKRGDKNNQWINYTKMQKENQDIAHLRVFECFLEAAPQSILQLTILLQNYQQPFSFKQWTQVCGICVSLVMIGITMFNYNRLIRLVQENKWDVTIVGHVLQFSSHCLIAVSRYISVAAVASVWLLYTLIFILLHWIGMTIWIIIEHSHTMEYFFRDRRRPPHTDSTPREKNLSRMLAVVYGVVYIFVYVNLAKGSTFKGRLRYYGLCFVENIIACALWAHFATPDIIAFWWYKFLIVLCIVPFFIGVMSMISYYYFEDITKMDKPAVTIKFNGTPDILVNYAPINEQSNDFESRRLG